jgi:hypothetical protein
MSDLNTQKTILHNTLATMDTYATMYFQSQTNTSALTNQIHTLEGQRNEMQARLNLEKQASEVHDRQFVDSTRSGKVNADVVDRGVNTYQDWVFLAFFSTYTLMIIVLVIYSSTFSSKKMVSIGAFLGGGIFLGIVMLGLLVRFA